MHSRMNTYIKHLCFTESMKLWRFQKLCLAFRIISISTALLSQVNFGCQCLLQILQLSLCRKALMWKIEDGCNRQGCYPTTPAHTHTHTTTDFSEGIYVLLPNILTFNIKWLNIKHRVKHASINPQVGPMAKGPYWPTLCECPVWIGNAEAGDPRYVNNQ